MKKLHMLKAALKIYTQMRKETNLNRITFIHKQITTIIEDIIADAGGKEDAVEAIIHIIIALEKTM